MVSLGIDKAFGFMEGEYKKDRSHIYVGIAIVICALLLLSLIVKTFKFIMEKFG